MLLLVMILTGGMMVVEFVGAWITNSISLLMDAVHMLTHFFAMAISYFAILVALRQAPRDKTFKYWRMEILAALFNGISLFPMIGYIFYEGIHRLNAPKPVESLQMFLVALAGLLVNLACAVILHKSSREDINVRGAFLHMLADSVSSVGVIAAAIVILLTGWNPADPIAALVVGLMILVWAVGLLRDSCRILLEAAPSHLDLGEVERSIRGVDGIRDIHDLHVWVITSKWYSLTAHVMLEEDLPVSKATAIVADIERMLDEKYDIIHACIQLESCIPECAQCR
ncbi:MAG: hypothetical protein A2Z34_01775 [Planctomycetes bacterium RBG_16_59_8]|nr:MAG: hypothetical protein A2Z34_01775 [Planctomycetes bacterium RBG_16_59_8]